MLTSSVERFAAAALGIAVAASVASAATHEQRSSVLIFPRVVVSEQHDTVIQIVNSSFLTVYVSCFYVDTIGETQVKVDMNLRLALQQSTHWSASRGRPVDATDQPCRFQEVADCDGAGFDPGDIPPVPEDFDGQLVCVQVDASGAPWSGNALLGSARILDASSAEAQTYPAVGLRGFDTNDGNRDLCLGGEPRSRCSKGAEYDACPWTAFTIHPTEDPNDDIAGSATSMTLASCDLDLDTLTPSSRTIAFQVTNELEQTLSASTTIDGYGSLSLSDISVVFQRDILGGDLAMTTVQGVGERGFAGIAETRKTADGSSTSVVLHGDPARPAASIVTLPE